MIDPYRMVFVNIIASASLFIGVLFYRYIYPKKKTNLFILLILISILPIISIFRAGIYESGDLSVHIQWLISFFETLKEGNLRPIWSSDLLFTYGYPIFLFIYPLPYYMGVLFHVIGFSFIDSIKIVFAISYVLSGIGMFLWINKKIGKISGFVASLFYLFAPYHLVDLHFRNAIGENVTFAILPFLFFFTDKYFLTNKKIWALFVSLLTSLIILSHQAITVVSVPLLIIYSVIVWRKNNNTFNTFLAYTVYMVFGVLLSSWFWIPLFINAKFTHIIPFLQVSFVNFTELIYSPWKFGILFQGPNGQLSFIIGYTHIIIIFISLYFLISKRFNKSDIPFVLFFLLSSAYLLLLTQSFTKYLWNNIPMLSSFQFSYRLLLPIVFFISALSGFAVKVSNRNIFIISLCLVTVGYTILNWGNRKIIPQLTDKIAKTQIPYWMNANGGIDSSSTIWYNPSIFRINKIPTNHISIINGDGEIYEKVRSTTSHKYMITANTPIKIRENTLYFPGWHITANGKKIPINFRDKKYPGIIIFDLQKGSYSINISLSGVSGVNISAVITFISVIFLAIYHYYLKLPSEKIRSYFAKKKRKLQF